MDTTVMQSQLREIPIPDF